MYYAMCQYDRKYKIMCYVNGAKAVGAKTGWFAIGACKAHAQSAHNERDTSGTHETYSISAICLHWMDECISLLCVEKLIKSS